MKTHGLEVEGSGAGRGRGHIVTREEFLNAVGEAGEKSVTKGANTRQTKATPETWLQQAEDRF